MSKRGIRLAFLLICVFLIIVPIGLCDGAIQTFDLDRWQLLEQDKQFCAINYHNGIQSMILLVNAGYSPIGEKLVWIFPVPATPDEISLNIIKGFPNFIGENIKKVGEEDISRVFTIIRLTQFYPLTTLLILRTSHASSDFSQGITIHQTIEKLGLKTELVSAKNASVLHDYLSSKELVLTPALSEVLQDYVNNQYSFVISWVSDIEEFKRQVRLVFNDSNNTYLNNVLGVYISFPTERIFYPLKMTSVYGNKTIPATIYVLNYVIPSVFPKIKKFTQVEYFSGKVISFRGTQDFFQGHELLDSCAGNNEGGDRCIISARINYTKIMVTAPSNLFVEDLWMDVSTPNGVKIVKLLIKFRWIYGILFLILSSCLASLISGVIVFRIKNICWRKFTLFGLWNLLSLPVFMIMAYAKKIDTRFTINTEPQYNRISLKKVIRKTIMILSLPLILLTILVILGGVCCWQIVGIGILVILVIAIVIGAIIYGLNNNVKILNFCLVFSLIFILLTYLFERLFYLIL